MTVEYKVMSGKNEKSTIRQTCRFTLERKEGRCRVREL